MDRTQSILLYDPRYTTSFGIGYAADSIAMSMNSSDLEVDVFSLFSDLDLQLDKRKTIVRNKLLFSVLNKFLGLARIRKLSEYKFKYLIRKYDIAYLWPGAHLRTFQQAKKHGKILVIESINCHQNTANQILDKEMQILGIAEYKKIPEASIADENLKLTMADYIFCPSPNVTKSMLENGIEPAKLIETSYGLGEHQRHYPKKTTSPPGELNGLFVGSGIIRKGIHLLLEYWRDANLKGKLVIVGSIDPAIEHIVKPYRDDSRFEFINFTKNIDQYFKQADVFMLPSLEEGSPLVTYLAIGAGLPCIVSPMGGEGVIRDGVDGYIIDPHDKSAWISVLSLLATNKAKLKEMSLAAYARSEYFLWHNVGQRRADALITRIGDKR
ncbi:MULTISPECIES: glycosyltransferase family 4 protein [unclassified Methylophaga]|jgi:glycosyltransferase involved in cell wall biosynthesis|uniref:glycosyltransferase family 4 protein n=4 Tax=Methylophaga TaxID=40222 RepID=UPI0025CE8096|nr:MULTISPECIES: glycosyltransferase family 4 protein [unclassified Methylophaga]|tara:strand:- start:19313 stop:20461 length:1149 start_codon:yes stop_codon:yes gene_type:complete